MKSSKFQRLTAKEKKNPVMGTSARKCVMTGKFLFSGHNKFIKRIDKMGKWRYNADKFSAKLYG